MKLSVVMTTYNNQNSIARAIDSLLGQTFRDFEFVIVNDGSTDETFSIIKSYEAKDRRIKVIDQQNFGPTKSLNIGINISSGEYIARQDADDFSLPERLKAQVELLDSQNRLGFIGCDAAIINDDKSLIYPARVRGNPQKIISCLKRANVFCHGAMVFRREYLKKVGGYREFFRYAQDYDLYLRLIEICLPGSVNRILYAKGVNLDGISVKKVNLQYAYAQLARQGHQLRVKGKDDSILLTEEGLDRVKIPLGVELVYPFMSGLNELKKGDTTACRASIAKYIFPIMPRLKFKLYLLYILTYLPPVSIKKLFNLKAFFRKIRYGSLYYNNGLHL
jgi:glycosyltransferase involved in cell wall biosynthesis